MSFSAGVTTPELAGIRAVLMADPLWAAYGLADLQPRFAPYCRWYLADSPAGPGLVLLFSGLTPPVLLTVGTVDGVEAALAQAPLPATIYMSARLEHLPALQAHYDFGGDVRPMLRMALVNPGRNSPMVSTKGSAPRGHPEFPPGYFRQSVPVAPTPAGAALDIAPIRLTPGDEARLRALYAHGGDFTPDAFDPYQVENGVFYGIQDGQGQLLAAGGTHIVDWRQGVAAIGNVYTRPDCRGRGYGTAVVQAVVAELRSRDVIHIVLNVDLRNQVARRLYTRLGFTVHCPFVEGIGHNLNTKSREHPTT